MQLTVALESCLALPELRQEGVLLPFYHSFVATFAHKLNPLRLAQLAVTVAQQSFAEPPRPQEAGAPLFHRRPCQGLSCSERAAWRGIGDFWGLVHTKCLASLTLNNVV